ncbi:MAG: hypothetical protein ACOY37_08040 [Pseudomonadota bacterium]
MNTMRELTTEEANEISGGILPVALIPVAVAFGKGLAAGAVAGGVAVAVMDALDIGSFEL